MHFFLSYLWHSPLIRLATIWFVIGIIGIAVFIWRLTGMREELSITNQKLQSYIMATQQLQEERAAQKKTQIDEILEEIEQFRPTVEELLNFVKKVEELAEKRNLTLAFHTVNTTKVVKKEENFVSYKLELTATLEEIEDFLKEFESLPYAIDIQSIDVSQDADQQYLLRLTFILHTKLT